MEFTGERIVPGSVNDDLLNEHLCRYGFAQLLVEERVVLDIGSGVGYGAKILAEEASRVVAVDLSEEAVRYAGSEYAAGNIEMVVGDAQDLPLASDSVDVVVSFELVEHLQSQQAHLLEISRVLKTGGIDGYFDTESSFLQPGEQPGQSVPHPRVRLPGVLRFLDVRFQFSGSLISRIILPA